MSDDYRRIELITGTARRRRWTTEQKLQKNITAKRPPLTTDPADDLKRSLLELKSDLKSASEARNVRSSRDKGGSTARYRFRMRQLG